MKKIFLIIIFFQLISIKSYSQIVYIDMNLILNNSQVGKSLNSYLKKLMIKNYQNSKK